MKTRTYLFIFSIASLSALGWWNHEKLARLRQDRDLLSARAVKLGVSAEAVTVRAHVRPDHAAEARLAASRFIQHHKQREAIKLAGGNPEASPETSALASQEWMAALDSKQIRLVIGEILNDLELDEKSRRKLIGQAVGSLEEKHPQAALSLFSEFYAQLKGTGMGRNVLRKALGNLAKENPQAAFAWARNHLKEYPGSILPLDTLISSAALQDPVLAFEMVRELGSNRNKRLDESAILRHLDPASRSTAFHAFRGHLATISDKWERRDVENRVWQDLAQHIAEDGFEAGSKWLLAVKPTSEELSGILAVMDTGLANSNQMDETGLWMEWIAKTLPSKSAELIVELMIGWTSRDYEAAGKWLSSAPEGSVKIAAIRSYAQTVFKHDPETAMQWIMTLPPGQDRQQTLRYIIENTLRDDPEAAATFAKEHGIEK